MSYKVKCTLDGQTEYTFKMSYRKALDFICTFQGVGNIELTLVQG